MKVHSWMFRSVGEPFSWEEREEVPQINEVIVAVAGCGVCHTDLGFYFEEVPTRHPLPLVLGHEVSGTVVEAGPGAEEWLGRTVIVPAVIPCGSCPACLEGHASICPEQVFPGCDVHGGYGTHLRVPAHGLCPVDDLPPSLTLADLSVVADAVTTPYQAIHRSGLAAGDLAVFVGVGGVGGFGVQIASALGAHVVAIDVREDRLELLSKHGAELCLPVKDSNRRDLKKAVAAFAKKAGIPTWRWRIFETSGHVAGQELAFELLRHRSSLAIVGYTAEKISIRLSNLMAFDATVFGNWGCVPELYPAALDLIRKEKVQLLPFVEQRPLSTMNETFDEVHRGAAGRRVVLCPE